MSDIRKQFSLAFDQVDPYARKLVYKTDDEGRTYRDFGDYLYTEDQLAGFMDYMNAEPNLLDARRTSVRSAMDEGRDPMEAVAMTRLKEITPIANLPYVADDVYGRIRSVRDAYQEDRNLDMLGHIAMLGLDVAPAVYGGYKGLKYATRPAREAYRRDRMDVAMPPASFRRQPVMTRNRGFNSPMPLTAGLLADVEGYLKR